MSQPANLDTTTMHQHALPDIEIQPARDRPSERQAHDIDLVAFSAAIVILLGAVVAILIRSMGFLWSDGSTLGWIVGGVALTFVGAVTILGLLRSSKRTQPDKALQSSNVDASA